MTERRQKNWGPAAGVLLLTILLGPPVSGLLLLMGTVVMSLITGNPMPLGLIYAFFLTVILLSHSSAGMQAIVLGALCARLVLLHGFYSKLAAAGLAVASVAIALAVGLAIAQLFGTRGALPSVPATFALVATAILLQVAFKMLGLIKSEAAAA